MDFIPLIPSDTNYRLGTNLGGSRYLFDVKWNSRDESFYMDIREEDERPILLGVRLVLGLNIGRNSANAFFSKHLLHLSDSSGEGREATFDDLGARVQLLHLAISEILTLEVP
jgi:hypothetical protein